ncbi:MAG TPA: LEA type 2 family protein [bacterium]|nr:LEA type 2 family protein [bacterium]
MTHTARWLALAIAVIAASCATRLPHVDAPPLTVSYRSVDSTGTSMDSARLEAIVTLENTGVATIAIESIEHRLGSDAGLIATRLDPLAVRLAPGDSASLPLRLDFQVPEGTAPLVPLLLESLTTAHTHGGAECQVSGSTTLEFPRVLAPVLEISSIRIIKDELINTRLRVDLAIHNPNAFALSFATLEYRLYGEGRYWADGSQPQPFDVPAGGAATASLFLTMNFTDMSRSLLDQVIRLATVNYRLAGAARIDTGLDFLPQFVLPFDMAGRATVTR